MRYYKNIGTGKNQSFADKAPSSNWVEISKSQFDKEATTSAPTPTPAPAPLISTQRVQDLFKQYGYTPTQNDINYWSDPNKKNDIGTLEDNLKARKAKETTATLTPAPTPPTASQTSPTNSPTRYFKNPTTGALTAIENPEVASLNNRGFSEISFAQYQKEKNLLPNELNNNFVKIGDYIVGKNDLNIAQERGWINADFDIYDEKENIIGKAKLTFSGGQWQPVAGVTNEITRDLEKEKKAIGMFGGQYGRMPESDADWAKVKEFAYGDANIQFDINTGKQTQSPEIPAGQEYKQSEEYQRLSDEMKKITELVANANNAKNEEEAKLALEALEQAKKIVNPYSKAMVDLAIINIPNNFNLEKLTAENKIFQAQNALNEIGAQINDLPLEEQQTFGEIARNFEQNITTLEDQSADAGLTYSTKRTDLERFVGQQNIDLVQSTERSFASKQRKLETAKKEQERQNDLLTKASEAQLKAIAQEAEMLVGTEKFNQLGLKGLGGEIVKPAIEGTVLKGSLEDERQQQLLKLSEQIRQFGGGDLGKLFNQ